MHSQAYATNQGDAPILLDGIHRDNFLQIESIKGRKKNMSDSLLKLIYILQEKRK